MAQVSSSTADAAPLAPLPEPPAAERQGGGAVATAADDDDNTFFPLLDLLERFPDLFAQKVLQHLDPIDRTFLAQTGGACRVVVVASDLPRAGRWILNVRVVTHKVREFCTSVEQLVWAKANGCPWVARICSIAAGGGHLEVLQWARENDCPWDARTCAFGRSGRAPGGVEVGAGARLPVGLGDVLSSTR